jgi:hypothetical protein
MLAALCLDPLDKPAFPLGCSLIWSGELAALVAIDYALDDRTHDDMPAQLMIRCMRREYPSEQPESAVFGRWTNIRLMAALVPDRHQGVPGVVFVPDYE